MLPSDLKPSTTSGPSPASGGADSAGGATKPRAVRVTAAMELAAAMRLVSVPESEREGAARRLLAAGPRHGIDFAHAWAVVDESGGPAHPVVRQVCLAIPGSGRTAVVFISDPPLGGDPGGGSGGLLERSACLSAAIGDMGTLRDGRGGKRVVVAQALPEPREEWSVGACLRSGFVKVGDLSYMRTKVAPERKRPVDSPGVWPVGVQVIPVSSIPEPRRDAVLIEALDATYIETLDCPELCGMRETADILESHRKTGSFDPAMWWLVFDGSSPSGCMLLAKCPEQSTVELVYLGLAPALRGKGIARRLMELALRATAQARYGELTCAVDARNAPAVHLYESCGLRAFAQRVALVCPV